MVFNLLSNAVKFTPAGRKRRRRSARRNGEVLVSVTDTGPGIAPEDHERIFEEFQQTDVGAEQREGTGLGLALSKRLVELHGGRIWVESELGQGLDLHFHPARLSDASPGTRYPELMAAMTMRFAFLPPRLVSGLRGLLV